MDRRSLLVTIFQIMSVTSAVSQLAYLGQGVMVGEVTDSSAIIQARITASDHLMDGTLPGLEGWVRYELVSKRNDPVLTSWIYANPENDYIAKALINGLTPGTEYRYQVTFCTDTLRTTYNAYGSFRTNPGPALADPVDMVVVTGMNYYHHYYGKYDSSLMYNEYDRDFGYPALEQIRELDPDYFIGTGDNVYYDHPAARGIQRARENGKNPLPGIFDGQEVTDAAGMRQKWHVQFAQPRMIEMLARLGTYWEKDDHDYRINDSDPYTDFPISHQLGIDIFREQVPIVPPGDIEAETYRTVRMSRDLQLWFVEGRDFRSANDDPDGPDKSIWGSEQKEWLYHTLLESDAPYKVLVSPTPMVGPDDAYKKDNHCNEEGFRYEGDAFFGWLTAKGFDTNRFFIVCGDRHWQYHAIHPSGYEEFSTGALVDGNSRAGRLAGDPESTDPEGLIEQPYVQGTSDQATGGFLHMATQYQGDTPALVFTFYDDLGRQLYQVTR